MQMPVCAVSSTKVVTEKGWIDMRGSANYILTFQLHRERGKTYLQVKISISKFFSRLAEN